jgi:molybdopterin/thiamine biosynthesis adenylyltransferase
MLTARQKERYARHILLEEVGEEGQQRLLAGKVLIVGVGGLGSPAAIYLAAAGIGTIGIADSDVVELSNLQRQIAHAGQDLGEPKVLSALKKLTAINEDVRVVPHQLLVNNATITDLISSYDFIIDATDNFTAKFLINDACVLAGKPYSHGGILKFDGQALTVLPGKSPCYRCIFPEPPPAETALACSRAGVIGVLPGIIGTIQATEAVKFLLNRGELLTGRLLTYNVLAMKFREVTIGRNPACPVCSDNAAIVDLGGVY